MRITRYFNKLLVYTVFLLVSCTIIEDRDITSPMEFITLRLKSLHIVQTLNAGNFTLDVPVTIGSNGKISTINWPDLGNHKLKFRTPITGPAVSILTYSSNGFLITFDTQVNSVSVEKYTFDHDTNGNLTSLVSVGSWGTDTDVLTYSSGVLSKITRNTSSNRTITIDSYGSLSTMVISTNKTYQLHASCDNSQDTFICGNYSLNDGSGSNSLSISNDFSFNLTQSISFMDSRQQGGSQRDPDIYYFHPLMITKDYFNNNKPLLAGFFNDWWSLGLSGTTAYNKNESVNINFVYAN